MNDCVGCKNQYRPAGASPFYEEVPQEVLQNHNSYYAGTQYALGVYLETSWNVPDETGDIAVKIKDVTNVPVGSYLYNSMYGYFKITQWNPKTNIIGLANERLEGNAAPGAFVPENSLFFLAPKPCCVDDSSTLFPFVAEDFVAPAVSQSRTVKVTSTYSLRAQDNVRINSGIYLLLNINSSKEIVIQNNGAGETPGTNVLAKDGNGEYQHLITSENASACAAPTTMVGRLISCDGNLEKILGGGFAGQVPVLKDAGASLVEFEFVDAEVRNCSELLSNLNILPATLTYNINVTSVVGFNVTDVIQINFSNLRFIINSIGVGTMNISATPAVPGITTTYVAGTPVCKTLTSEYILNQLSGAGSGLQSQITALDNDLTTYVTSDTAALAAEVAARTAADTAEIAARTAANVGLTTALNAEIAGRISTGNAETTARAAADTATNAAVSILQALTAAYKIAQVTGASGTIAPASLTTGSQNGNAVELVITNPGTRPMVGVFLSTASIGGYWSQTSTTRGDSYIYFETQSELRTGVIGATAAMMGTYQSAGTHNDSRQIVGPATPPISAAIPHNRSFSIAAGQEARCRFRSRIILQNLGTADFFGIGAGDIDTQVDGIGVAL